MWVRSQNKVFLGNYIEFFIDDKQVKGSTYGSDGYCILGEYESEQRALKVLDDMQKHLGMFRDDFNMPQE